MKPFIWLIAGVVCIFLCRSLVYAQVSHPIQVTGTVAPQSTELQVSIQPLTPKDPISPGDVVSYEVSYGTSLYYAANLTVQITWDGLLFSGDSQPSATDILEYVPQSATAGYGGTSPVIDTLHKTITWTILSFPSAQSGSKLRFDLRVNDNYKGLTAATVAVHANLETSSITVSSTTSKNYFYIPTPTPSPTNTPTPTIAPTASPTPIQSLIGEEPTVSRAPTAAPSATPTPTSRILPTLESKTPTNEIQDIHVVSITSTQSTISVTTVSPAQLTIRYGTSPTQLTSTKLLPLEVKSSMIILDTLAENTPYYFQIEILTATNKITSDIYRFKTAVLSEIPSIDHSKTTISSFYAILHDSTMNVVQSTKDQTKIPPPNLVIPSSKSVIINFTAASVYTIKRVKVYIRNSNVLGIGTQLINEHALTSNTIEVFEVAKNSFMTRFSTPTEPGYYEILAQLFDENGNVIEEKLATMHVTHGFIVKNAKTLAPIENAQVDLIYLDPTNRIYSRLPQQVFLFETPLFTQRNGDIALALPLGSYKATVSSLGYTSQTIDFTIGLSNTETYPEILLVPEKFSVITEIRRVTQTISDIWKTQVEQHKNIANSNRYFEFQAILALSLFVIVSFISFGRMIAIPFLSIPSYFLHIFHLGSLKRKDIVSVTLLDAKTKKPISGVVTLQEISTDAIVGSAKTSGKAVRFFLHPKLRYRVIAIASGYIVHEQEINMSENVEISLTPNPSIISSNLTILLALLDSAVSYIFGYILILSFIAELSLNFTLGVSRTIFFLALSSFNLLLWIIHRAHVSQRHHD